MKTFKYDCTLKLEWKPKVESIPDMSIERYFINNLKEYGSHLTKGREINSIFELINFQAELSFKNLNCHARIANYSQKEGSLKIVFTLVLTFYSFFISYRSIRQSIDFFISDIKTIVNLIDPKKKMDLSEEIDSLKRSIFPILRTNSPIIILICILAFIFVAIFHLFKPIEKKISEKYLVNTVHKISMENEIFRNTFYSQLDMRLENLESTLSNIAENNNFRTDKEISISIDKIKYEFPAPLLKEINVFAEDLRNAKLINPNSFLNGSLPTKAIDLADKVLDVGAPFVTGTKELTFDVAKSFLDAFAKETGEVTPNLIADIIKNSLLNENKLSLIPKTSFIVYFDFNSSKLPKSAIDLLKSLCDARIFEYSKVSLIGSADRSGSDRLNNELAQARINAVRSYLLSHGIEDTSINTEIKIEGMAPIHTSDGVKEPENRRVELKVIQIDN
jgi:outer membrane protein OmpA-like peptidoglycan-associated protein